MSFNRSGYIGRAPGDSSIVLAKQYFQPTGAGRTFTFTAGYDPGLIDVYRNGVKLINTLDYAATDGETIVLDTPVGVGSTVQVVAYKGFNVTEVNSSAGDFSVGSNLYVQSGFGSFSQGITANQINVSGIGTIGIGSFTDINVSGGATVDGTLVAGSFSGDGSALTGVGQTLNVRTLSLTVAGVSTLTGAVNVDATTDSTSVTTGALIVDGGVGIAKNVYIGAGLSVAGTLTYEDVTNVDSVGMVTAKSGLNVSGGEVTVGSAVTIGSAGVTTFIGAAGVGVTITPSTGKVEATTFYGDGSNLSNITTTTINNNADNRLISGSGTANTLNGESTLTYDGTTLALTGNETISSQLTVGSGITMGSAGVATFSGTADVHLRDNVQLNIGDGSDLIIRHDGSHSYIEDAGTGNLYIESSGLVIMNAAGSENMASFSQDGGCVLYNNNINKFETTTTGATITGEATATLGLIVGSGLTIGSTGIATFADGTYSGGVWTNALKFGTGGDTTFWQDGSNFYIQNTQGNIVIRPETSDAGIVLEPNSAVTLYHDNYAKLATTNDGVVVTGIMTASAGVNYDGLLSEKFNTVAGKLSSNTNIDLENGMVHYFTTTENSTSTPNIRYSSTKSLDNMLSTGDAITVTIITTAAAAAYSANMSIDGGSQTEEWVGGSAPSEGGADGHDIYTYNILKTAGNTYKVIANYVNATN